MAIGKKGVRMAKQRLMTPGPTEVPESALLCMAKQVTHHRTPEFRGLLTEAFAGLKYAFATENDVLVLTSSGTGAMEAAVVNVVPRGGKAIVLESGKFAERWRKICETYGIEVVRYEVPWGQPFDPIRLAELLKQHSDAVAVYGTLLETSTGVGHDIEAIGRVVKASHALWVVDGISGVGAMECRTDAWGIDILVVGSQKALMTPPGLAFLAVSPAAWRQIESIPRQAFYFDLLAYRKALADSDTPYTPAIPLVKGLVESLRIIRTTGIETIWEKTKLLANATRAGVEAIGLHLAAACPADGMTAVFFPEGVDGKVFCDRLLKRFGIKVAGGQGDWKGRIFRIAHMGMVDELDIISTLAAIELALAEMGQDVKLGASVTAASRVFCGKGC
jgi:serine---pyruvate transaminase